MRYRFELSAESQRQLSRFPRDAQERLARAIDDLESKDDSQWSNVKALQGAAWKGLLRKKVGGYRIIFRELQSRGIAEIAAILIKSKDTYR
jgi:mRNA-degrading endonuclease RelE of RelBE toxin-antitoxin system